MNVYVRFRDDFSPKLKGATFVVDRAPTLAADTQKHFVGLATLDGKGTRTAWLEDLRTIDGRPVTLQDLAPEEGNAPRDTLAGKIAALLPDGYTFDPDASTGGGCRAMCIQATDGRSVEITDGDSDLPFTDPDMPDVVFSYFADNEPDGELILETGQDDEPDERFWEGFDVSLKAWISGDPYREI